VAALKPFHRDIGRLRERKKDKPRDCNNININYFLCTNKCTYYETYEVILGERCNILEAKVSRDGEGIKPETRLNSFEFAL
jgi:hypothetical protein